MTRVQVPCARSSLRRTYFAALGRASGTATLKKYGRGRMVELGEIGAAVTLGCHSGDFVCRLLRNSYLAKLPDRDGPLRRTTPELVRSTASGLKPASPATLRGLRRAGHPARPHPQCAGR
jgi:hypothetical protein